MGTGLLGVAIKTAIDSLSDSKKLDRDDLMGVMGDEIEDWHSSHKPQDVDAINVDIADVGDRFIAKEAENALQELAGAGRVTQSVKGNADDISTNGDGIQTNADDIAALTLPGSEMLWPTETPPDGWLEENGAVISRTFYAALFDVIGTWYGVGDGSTTFKLPDMRGQFIRIWAHGSTVDPNRLTRTNRGDGTLGDHVGTKQGDAIHTHEHYCKTRDAGGASTNYIRSAAGSGTENNTHTGVEGVVSGGATAPENRSKNVYRMMVIKY